MAARNFATTCWTAVRAVRTVSAERRRAALAALCEAYWSPIYAFIRRHGHDPDAAADLTQSFFVHVIERHALDGVDPALGRFRAFLLASVKHFLANERDRQAALKRGGRAVQLQLDPGELEGRCDAARSQALDPEQAFERQWAATVLQRALARVAQEQELAGRGREFVALSPFLTSDEGPERPYRDVAVDLGTTEVAVRTAVHRLRGKLGASLRSEVADTVADPAAGAAELRRILLLLAR